jgi:hypothetical protein
MSEPAMTLLPVISVVALIFLPMLLPRRWFLFYSFVCTFALGTIWITYIYEAPSQERHAGGSPGESFGPILFLFMPSLLFLAGIALRYVVNTHLFSESPDGQNAIENNDATTHH